MTEQHRCTFFDDGDGRELLCACGRRALLVRDEDSGEPITVPLIGEAAAWARSA